MRRRVFLVVDLGDGGGTHAPQILFEPCSLPRDSESDGEERQDAAGSALQSTDAPGVVVEYHSHNARIGVREDGTVQTLTGHMGTGGNNVPLVLEPAYSTSRAYYHTRAFEEKVDELHASDYKDPNCVLAPETAALRRITPLECARLQGFPDDWTDGLEQPDPDEAELAFWQGVWDTWNDMRGTKRKSAKQIRTWLRQPPTDAAKYKMWGNGVALPCVQFIMDGIAGVRSIPAAQC